MAVNKDAMRAGIFKTTIETVLDMGVQENRHFKLTFEPGTEFDFVPGQFVNAMAPSNEDPNKLIKRPYSIASAPYQKGYIDLVWKRIEGGFMTNYFWKLKQGDSLQIQGPLGRFTLKEPLPKRIAFVATGTGIAPFRSMIYHLFYQNTDREVWLLFGNRYDTDILYHEEWKALEKERPNFHYVPTVSRTPGWGGEEVYVQKLLPKYLRTPQDTHVYICGLTKMINEVQETTLQMGFPKEQVFFEKYD